MKVHEPRTFGITERILIIMAMLAACTGARAAIIVEYDANAEATAPNPTSVTGGSWTAGGLNPAGVTETSGQEAGQNYWETNDDNAGGTANSSRSYFLPLTAGDVGDPAGWTATLVVKVLSASNTPSGVTFEVRGGGKLVNLSFIHNGASELVGQSVGGNTAIVPIQSLDLDAYNTFQMWYDPSDQLVDVYINGSFASTITPGVSGLSRVLWGSNTSSATGVARWREVKFETGFAIIPEPASIVLLGIAALALGTRRRSRLA